MSQKPAFFIFALPRSGTAWLSVFLCGRDSYCYHEPTADFTPAEWARRAQHRPEKTIGAIDTGAFRYPALIEAALLDARIFSLRRDSHEIADSLEPLGMQMDLAQAQQMLASATEDRLIIQYAYLSDLNYLEEVWRLVIGTEFDRERAQALMEMRIERDVEKFIAYRPGLAAHMRSLLS